MLMLRITPFIASLDDWAFKYTIGLVSIGMLIHYIMNNFVSPVPT